MTRTYRIFRLFAFSFMAMLIVALVVLFVGRMDQVVEAKGIVDAQEFSLATSGARGVIDRIYVKEGDYVRRGQILGTLHRAQLDNDLDKANLELEQSRHALADLLRQEKASGASTDRVRILTAREDVLQARVRDEKARQKEADLRQELARARGDRAKLDIADEEIRYALEQRKAHEEDLRRLADLVAKNVTTQAELRKARMLLAGSRSKEVLARQRKRVVASERQERIEALEREIRAAQAATQLASSTLRVRRKELERVLAQVELDRNLLASKIVQARNRATQAQKDLALARRNRAEYRLVARDNGAVVRLQKKEGEFLERGSPLVAIAPVEKVRFVAHIAQSDLPKVRLGLAARLYIDAFPHTRFRVFAAKVSWISPTASREEDRSVFKVELAIDDPWVELPQPGGVRTLMLKPGLSGRCEIVARRDVRLIEALYESLVDRGGA